MPDSGSGFVPPLRRMSVKSFRDSSSGVPAGTGWVPRVRCSRGAIKRGRRHTERNTYGVVLGQQLSSFYDRLIDPGAARDDCSCWELAPKLFFDPNTALN